MLSGMIILALMYCFMGTIILMIKCCGATKRRLQRRGTSAELTDNTVTPAAATASSDQIPEDLLMELERIFERIEEGRIEESGQH